MFADLSGSTRLYEMLGDSAAKDVITASLARLVVSVAEHDGRVVKTIGDEILAVFNSAHEAVLAARLMVKISSENQDIIPNGSRKLLQIRVGMHFGRLIEEEGDVFGDAVNTAARMVSLARSNTIVVSHALYKALPQALRHMARFYDSAVVRGKARPLDVYQVITDAIDHDKTMELVRTLEITTELTTLELAWGENGKTIEVSGVHPTVTVGRGPENDIVSVSSMVSREHARIDYKHGKFYLTDFSNNGTFIELVDGTRTLIRKSDYRLILSGCLYFGEEPGPHAQTAVRYRIDDNSSYSGLNPVDGAQESVSVQSASADARLDTRKPAKQIRTAPRKARRSGRSPQRYQPNKPANTTVE